MIIPVIFQQIKENKMVKFSSKEECIDQIKNFDLQRDVKVENKEFILSEKKKRSAMKEAEKMGLDYFHFNRWGETFTYIEKKK